MPGQFLDQNKSNIKTHLIVANMVFVDRSQQGHLDAVFNIANRSKLMDVSIDRKNSRGLDTPPHSPSPAPGGVS
jgi:hypothetical protein